MSRKFVQIAAIPASSVGGEPYVPVVFGLDSEGAVWYSTMNPRTDKFDKWESMPDINETEYTPPRTA
jgi:hypothetical protein